MPQKQMIIIQCAVNYIIFVCMYIFYIHILLLGGNVRFICLSLFSQFKKRIILRSVSAFLLIFTLSWAEALTGCGGHDKTVLTVTPASGKLPIGVPVYIKAEAKSDGGVIRDVSRIVEWSSSDAISPMSMK